MDRDLFCKKLANRGLHFRLIGLVRNWLDARIANVAVAGKKSVDYVLSSGFFRERYSGQFCGMMSFLAMHVFQSDS